MAERLANRGVLPVHYTKVAVAHEEHSGQQELAFYDLLAIDY